MMFLMFVMFLFLSYFLGVGYVYGTVLTKNNFFHASVYGFLMILGMFNLLSIPLVFFHVSWNVFFIVQSIGQIVLIAVAMGLVISKKVRLRFNRKMVIQNLCENWLLYVIIIIFIVIYISSGTGIYHSASNLRFNFASTDDHVYIGKVLKAIGSNSINPLYIDTVTGPTSTANIFQLVSYWELFIGYVCSLSNVNVLVVQHTVIPIIIFVIAFNVIDELLLQLIAKKIVISRSAVLLSFLLLYTVMPNESEVYKFLFLPWFSNVFSLVILIPLLFIIIIQIICYDNMKTALLFFPLFAAGITGVSVLYVGFSYMLVFVVLWMCYHKKFRWFYLLYVAIVVLVFLSASIYNNLGILAKLAKLYGTMYTMKDFFLIGFPVSERSYFIEAIRLLMMLFTIGPLILLVRKSSMTRGVKLERVIIFTILCFLFILSTPVVGTLLFNLFNFPLRRLSESLLLALCAYSIAKLFAVLSPKRVLKISLVIMFIGFTYYPQKWFIKNHASFFSLNNMKNLEKTSITSKKIADFLSSDATTKTVCVYRNGRSVTTPYGEFDLMFSVMLDPNAYFIACSLDDTYDKVQYVIALKSFNAVDLMQNPQMKLVAQIDVVENVEEQVLIYKMQ